MKENKNKIGDGSRSSVRKLQWQNIVIAPTTTQRVSSRNQ